MTKLINSLGDMKKINSKNITLKYILLIIFVLFFLLSLIFIGVGPPQMRTDSRRTSDMRQVQSLLELYYQKEKKYPLSQGATASERWSNLVSEIKNVIPQYAPNTPTLPQDPKYMTEGRSYDYGTSLDSQLYVVQTELDSRGNSEFSGIIYNINCDSPYICFSLKSNTQK